MANIFFRVEGMKELQKSLKKLGKVPQKHVTSTSKKAMNIVLRQAKKDAPEETGALKQGMILHSEKSRYKAKKVYQVIFDPSMNDVFQKPVQNVGESGSPNAKNPAYYPMSQEYGFFARDGRYIPGYRFIHDSFQSNVPQIEKTIVSEMKKKIDAEIVKAGLS
jgi:hypothetical protein